MGYNLYPQYFVKGKKYRDGIELSTAQPITYLKTTRTFFIAAPASVGEYLEIFKQTAK